MQISDILDASLGSLEFDRNRCLFLWPAELLSSDLDPVGGALDSVKEPPFKDFGYKLHHGESPPIGWGDRPDQPVPDLDFREFREMQNRIKGESPHDKPPDLIFARPTTVAADDLVNQQLSVIHQNTVQISSLESDLGDFVDGISDPQTIDTYWDGVVHVFNFLTREIVDIDLLKPSFAASLGLDAVVQVVRSHLLTHGHKEHIEAHIAYFKKHELVRLRHAEGVKCNRIREQIMIWSQAGKQAVLNSDGSINQACSLSNQATAVIAIRQLAALSIDIFGFCQGVDAALEAIAREFTI